MNPTPMSLFEFCKVLAAALLLPLAIVLAVSFWTAVEPVPVQGEGADERPYRDDHGRPIYPDSEPDTTAAPTWNPLDGLRHA